MKIKLLLFISIILFTFPSYNSFSVDYKTAVNFGVSRSLTMVPFRDFREVEEETRESYKFNDYKLVENIVGLSAGVNFKVKRKLYLQMNLEYNFFSINDKFREIYNNDLTAGNAVFSINWIQYIDKPDRLTPFFGIGIGVSVTNANQDDISWSYLQDDEFNINKGEVFFDVAAMLSLKGGVLIPIDEVYSLTPSLDVNLFSHEFIGVYPKLSIGLMRWL